MNHGTCDNDDDDDDGGGRGGYGKGWMNRPGANGNGAQMVSVDVVLVTESLSPRWIIELLKYSNGVVLLDI